MVSFRRDYRDASGVLRDGEYSSVYAKIVAIRKYNTFLDMTTTRRNMVFWRSRLSMSLILTVDRCGCLSRILKTVTI